MSQLFQALVLGIVQGLTEFLPVSSTAHLIIVPWFFHWSGVVSSLPFDLALHIGTTIAVLGFFWRDWAVLIGAFVQNLSGGIKKVWGQAESRLFLLILIGSVPAGIAGALLDKVVESAFRTDIVLIAALMIIFSFVLYWADSRVGKRQIERVHLNDSLLVGVVQIIALLPGVSRSGITITAGLARGLDRESATRFSFLLSTPVIVGAALFKFKDIAKEGGFGTHLDIFLIGTIAAAVSGWLAIKFLITFVQKNNFKPFVIYRIVVGVILLFLVLKR